MFIDELAREARASIRSNSGSQLLKDTPRAPSRRSRKWRRWPTGAASATGRGLGFAYLDYSGTQVAGIAEVSLDRGSGAIKVHNFWCTIDCGVAVQPDNVIAQTESSIVYGLGLALTERITIANGAVEQSNFYDYHVPRMTDVPEMHIKLIATEQPSDRRRADGDAAGAAGDLQRGGRADRRAPASAAVHCRSGSRKRIGVQERTTSGET